MAIDFSFQDITTIYARCRKELARLEAYRDDLVKMFGEDAFNEDVGKYTSVTSKIETIYPDFKKYTPPPQKCTSLEHTTLDELETVGLSDYLEDSDSRS